MRFAARLLGLILLARVALGCQGAHDASRAGILSVAGAAKVVENACYEVVSSSAKNSEWLSKAQLQAVLSVGEKCQTGLEKVRPLLDTAAKAVDASGPESWAGACAALEAATVLTDLLANVRMVGGTVPREVDEALRAGKWVSTCSGI